MVSAWPGSTAPASEASRQRRSRSTACSTSPRPTTCGPWTRATGRELWHYAWQSKGGIHIGNRGVGVYGNWLYFETPDCNIVSLNLKDGKERWHKTNCDLDQFYYGSVAPLIVRNHVIAGVSGDDLDRPGYLSSYDPETGDLQWRWYAVPQKKGDPGAETWPNEEAMRHGGGMTWQVPTYDPELNLLYVTTGNPQPVIAHKNRAGANLFTACIVALNPDTGKDGLVFPGFAARHPRLGRHPGPVLIDGEINGQPRKMVALAARNGYFFLLDRTNGKNLVTSQFVPTNWAKGVDSNGVPIPDPAKMPQVDGALVSPNQGGATNWPPADASAHRPACSTFPLRAPSASIISSIWTKTRKAGEEPISGALLSDP